MDPMDREPASSGRRAATTDRDEPGRDDLFLEEVGARFAEVRKHLVELWNIKIAELKLSLWDKVFAVAAGILGLVFVMAVVGVSVFFLLAGAADGFSNAVDSRWLGSVLAGLLGVVLVAGGLIVAKRILQKSAVRPVKEKKDD